MNGYIFDIDDTLYSRHSLLARAAGECAGITPAQENRFQQIFARKALENTPQVERREITALESNIWRFAETFRVLGIRDADAKGERAAVMYTDLQGHITLVQPLREMFDALVRRGAVIGALTTGDPRHQWKKFDMLGLGRWIPRELVAVSGETGFTKPDPGAFHIMEERTGLTPENLWMIGDSYGSDICGAAGCGWHTIWINRGNAPVGDIVPDLTCRDEAELAQAVTGLLSV